MADHFSGPRALADPASDTADDVLARTARPSEEEVRHRVLIQYGRPRNPEAFDQYYRDVHAPLARTIPGLLRFETGHAEPIGTAQAPYLVVTLDFESFEAFAAGLRSPEYAAVLGDVPRFATGGARLSHYDVEDITADRGGVAPHEPV